MVAEMPRSGLHRVDGDLLGKLTVLALRVVLATGLAGSLFVQVVMVPLLAVDLRDDLGADLADVRTPLLILTFLGIVTVQVAMVCVWRLLTMVQRDTMLSHVALRHVDIVVGATAAASLLTLGVAVTLAPGEAVPPGIVLLICGAAVMVAGVALIVLVLRMLLAQAIARDAKAHHLQS